MRTIGAGSEPARRLVDYLDGVLRRRGHGAIRWFEKKLGVTSGWWCHRRKTGDMSVSAMVRSHRVLGLNSARVLQEVVGTNLAGRHEPAGEPPRIVGLVRERLAAGEDRPAPREGSESGDGSSFIKRLEQQVFKNPARAVAMGEVAVQVAQPELLPRILGIVGSAYRRWNTQLDAGEHCIQAGLEIAWDPLTVGDLLQRLAYNLRDRGDFLEALALSDRAALIYVDAGDLVAVGKTCVDRGIFRYYLNRLPEAIAALESSLDYLPDSQRKSRFSSFQVLGLCHRELKNTRRAAEYAGKALELLPTLDLGGPPKAKLLWLLAEIAIDSQQFLDAESHLLQVVEILESNPLDAALATTDLVRVQFLQGRPFNAYQTARTMLGYLEPLKSNKMATAAIVELLRSEEAFGIELVEQVKSRLERARDRRGPHALGP